MIDFKDYSYYLDSPLTLLEDIVNDITETCELPENQRHTNPHQELVVNISHRAMRPQYGETLMLFVGIKFFHWFYESDGVDKSVHLKRASLLHLSDAELVDVFVDALENKAEWLDCDISELEALMPHTNGSAICFECDVKWDYMHTILSKERGIRCPICESENVLFSDQQTLSD